MLRRRCLWACRPGGVLSATVTPWPHGLGTSRRQFSHQANRSHNSRPSTPPRRQSAQPTHSHNQRRHARIPQGGSSLASAHTVHIALGNGLSAAVTGAAPKAAKKHMKSSARAGSSEASHSTMTATAPASVTVASTVHVHDDDDDVIEQPMLPTQRGDSVVSMRAAVRRLAEDTALIGDCQMHSSEATVAHARQLQAQLSTVDVPLLFQLADAIYPELEAAAVASATAAFNGHDTQPSPLPLPLSTTTIDNNNNNDSKTAILPATTSVTSEQWDRLLTAQTHLSAWLAILDETAAHTGRRYEAALPTALVAALWLRVMPVVLYLSRTSGATPAQRRACHTLRRGLAVRLREVAGTMPPALLTRVLGRVQQCGALSDDVLGPVAAQLLDEQRHGLRRAQAAHRQETGHALADALPSSRGLRRQMVHPVAAAEPRHLLFQGADAITMTRILGRAAVPGHFQLHTLVHTVLLPVVRRELHLARQTVETMAARAADSPDMTRSEAAARDLALIPSRQVLVDLTRCFIQYAVSGQAAEDIAVLWAYQLQAGHVGGHVASVQDALDECRELLQMLSPPPSPLSSSSSAAADDYLALAEHVCETVCRLGQHSLAQLASTESAAPPAQSSSVSLETALDLVHALLGVNSVRWAETYAVAATLALNSLTQRITLVASQPDAELVTRLQSLLRGLRRRGSQVPVHPLHALAARLVLYSDAALHDARVAGTALISFATLVPGTATDTEAPVSAAPPTAADAAADDHHHHGTLPQSEEKTLVEAAALAVLEPRAADTRHALALLLAHAPRLPVTSFAAALTLVPLSQLSLAQQTDLVHHLASRASALPPLWLARGIVACADGLPATVMDPISVQRLCSRFTARDVVRWLPLSESADLLRVLSRDEATSANNALAKAALVKHVGVLLRRDVDGATHTQLDALMDVPHVIAALRASQAFFVHLFSRICRLLLGQVEQAPWDVLLPAFAATADEYTRRPPHQSRGTVFRDAWELLRGRVLEAATGHITPASTSGGGELMGLDDVVLAINAFAVLDVQDTPLFSVLVYALVNRCAQALATGEVDQAVGVVEDDERTHQVDLPVDSTEARHRDALAARSRVALGQRLLSQLTPSAVAVVTRTLLLSAASTPSLDDTRASLLSWLLMALRDGARDLYPMDVVLLMASLPRFIGSCRAALPVHSPPPPSSHSPGELASTTDVALSMALASHAYDACRAMFLLMYETPESDNAASTTTTNPPEKARVDDGDVITSGAARTQLAAQRALWPPKAIASIKAVPCPLFADVLSEMTTCEWLDRPVAVACAQQLCTRRVCREGLTMQQLVDVTMSLSVQLHAPPDQVSETAAPAAAEAATATTSTTTAAQRFLPVVLNALWDRTDELTAAQVDALVRFLRHQYGAKVDQDFVDRLVAQRDALAKPAEPRSSVLKERKTTAAAGETLTAAAHAEETNVMDAEDLFNLM